MLCRDRRATALDRKNRTKAGRRTREIYYRQLCNSISVVEDENWQQRAEYDVPRGWKEAFSPETVKPFPPRMDADFLGFSKPYFSNPIEDARSEAEESILCRKFLCCVPI